MSELWGLLALLALAAVLLVVLLSALIMRTARRPPRRGAGYAIGRGMASDPGELGLGFESWAVERPGGEVLPVWEIDSAPGDAGSSAPLTAVLLHAWGESRIDLLARSGLWRELADRVVLYDRRGHGDAEGEPSPLGCGEDEDLLALLEQLGEGSFLLVGWSMGAVIALTAAATDEPGAQRIAGVVAYGAYMDFRRSLARRVARTGAPARPMIDLGLLWLRLRGVRPLPWSPLGAGVECPVLVVQGADDSISPPADGRAIAAAATRATLLEIEGAGHLDAPEVDPERHEEAVRAFLGRVESDSAV